WGGAKEQAEEQEKGNLGAKNWQDEARKILENMMEKYWKCQPAAIVKKRSDTSTPSTTAPTGSLHRDFHEHRKRLIHEDQTREVEGWQSELRRYLKVVENVNEDVDIVEWWQNHVDDYPTLARIAIDYLPSQASSVPCERLFSRCKETTVDRRSRLSNDKLEQLQILKSAWYPTI
ncbi:hypothetical protein M378DRAFT_52073, partial [Amanita muscaria Koide BX008]